MPLGAHRVALRVTDPGGLTETDTVTITVVDTKAPTFKLNVLPDTLWPVNHKMALAATVTDVRDIRDANPTVSITVTSNEQINGSGDGNTSPDWEVARNGAVWEVWLRAERSGNGSGRKYYVAAAATDASDRRAEAKTTVTVPHDQGKGAKK